MRTGLLAIVSVLAALQEPGPEIRNPYFRKTEWKVWRLDDAPVENLDSLARKEGKEVPAVVTLAPRPSAERVYPADGGGAVRYRRSAEPSREHAGMWDDVYASWSGLHGYLWRSWKGADGGSAPVLDEVMHFVDVTQGGQVRRCGVNFVHKSTTGMGHTIANGYDPRLTERFERIYYSDCLVTAPGHLSFADALPERSDDLYTALFPAIFNSLGSSNSETMGIAKMIAAGGYLPPETKLLLKKNGLYPAAMLYLWKAALPYRVPYDHELRHRVVYGSVGEPRAYPGGYNHAGLDRGDLSLAYHSYDDELHMRNMAGMARAMKIAPPEAVLKVLSVEGGLPAYALKKAALVVQEPGRDVTIRVSAEDCYDLQDRPLRVRWTLLYGNRQATCRPEGKTWVLRVPWDDRLPEGRTAFALVAHNGAWDSNPAIVNVYRKKGDLPPHGRSYGDYVFKSPHANRRPALGDLQDRAVEPGKTVSFDVQALDPEGFPVRFHLREGEPGEMDGNRFTWTCPADAQPGVRPVTLIASDGTSGNGYAGKKIGLHVSPKVFARIVADRTSGAAPLQVRFRSESAGRELEQGWDVFRREVKPRARAFDERAKGGEFTHTFERPGLYTVSLAVKGPSGAHETTVEVLVTEVPAPARALDVEGNGVLIRNGETAPCEFDHTDFGTIEVGRSVEREFLIHHPGSDEIRLGPAVLSGSPDFTVARQGRDRLGPGGSTVLRIRCAPSAPGARDATVTLAAGGSPYRFAVRAAGR